MPDRDQKRKGGPAPEQIDVLDCAGRRTGARIERDEAHRTGVWHGAFHGLMIYRRGGRECALLQKRSAAKAIAPGKFDVSAGGHYAAGEDARTAGPREIREELGLTVAFADLVPAGRRVFVYCFPPGVTELEFQDVFLLPRELRQEDLVLQEDEVDAVLELDITEGIALLSGRVPAVPGTLFRNGMPAGRTPVCAEDFVPCVDRYYLKILLLAQRYLRGERETLVI